MADTNFQFTCGQSFSFVGTVNTLVGQPRDVTGYTVACQLTSRWSGVPVATLNAQITAPVQGQFAITSGASDTFQIATGVYNYDVLLADELSLDVEVLMSGTMTILPEYTTIPSLMGVRS